MKGSGLKKLSIGFVMLVIMLPPATQAQVTIGGSKGLLRIYEAETVTPGRLVINSFYSLYMVRPQAKARIIEDHTINLGITLSLSRLFELHAHFVPYQDNQQPVWGPIGDTRVGIKFANPMKGKTTKVGLVGFASFPTATHHNVPYEPFSLDAGGWGLLATATLDFKEWSGTLPLKFSLNIGYRDLDWHDRYFLDKKDQLIGGLGLKFPVQSSVVYSELTGEFFFNNTERISFKQNHFRFTQGLRFVGPYNLVWDLAADVELGGYSPSREESAQNPMLKNYADWKIYLGVSYRTTLFKRLTEEEKLARERQQEELKRLESIRQKREDVFRELEELRKKLEKEKRKEPDLHD